MFPPESRILVVDDMAAMRLRVSNQLTSFGFKNVDQAGDGQEAFNLVQKMHDAGTPIQLIISDWNMPVLSGLDFLVKLKGHDTFKKIPFLMVTAEGEKDQVIRAIKAGVSDYLIKPVNQESLQSKMMTIWKKNNPS